MVVVAVVMVVMLTLVLVLVADILVLSEREEKCLRHNSELRTSSSEKMVSSVEVSALYM